MVTENSADDQTTALVRRQRDLILEATGDGIYGLDANSNTTFVNPAAARMSGYTVDEMLGANLHDLIHHTRTDGSHYHVHDCPIFAAVRDGKIHRVSDELFWRKDGSSYPVEYISTPIWDEGNLVGAVVSFRDITDQKLSEEELRKSEERYRTLFDDSHAAGFLIDCGSFKIVDSNKQSSRLLGYSAAEMIGKTRDDIFGGPAKDLEAFFVGVEQSRSGDTEDLWLKAADGTRISVRLSASKMQIGTGEGLLILANDTRRRNEAEAHARQLQSELHHVSRLSAMGEMASAMAHELNQPLTAVMNYTQASRRLLDAGDENSNEQATEYMDKAVAQAVRAGEIIRGLRSFVEKSDADMSFENINDIIEEAIVLTIPSAIRERFRFETDLAADLPETLVHRIKIQQVVVNLVRNAVEALSNQSDGQLTVVTGKVTNSCIEVSVCDNGPGLTDKQQSEVFQSFMTTKQQGMGVGLSICRSIIDDHNGKLWAEKSECGGAIFKFTLPIIAKRSDDSD